VAGESNKALTYLLVHSLGIRSTVLIVVDKNGVVAHPLHLLMERCATGTILLVSVLPVWPST
jgi:hypothetical protein